MINSYSFQGFPNENENPNMFPTSTGVREYKINNYQIFNEFNTKKGEYFPKHYSEKILTTHNYDYKNIKPSILSQDIIQENKNIFNSPLYLYNNYKEYPTNQYNNENKISNGLQRHHSSRHLNFRFPYLEDIFNDKNSNIANYDSNEYEILNTSINCISNENNEDKLEKLLSKFSDKDLLPKQTINQYENNNYDTNIDFCPNNEISNNFDANNINLDNNNLNSSFISEVSMDNLNINCGEEEPSSNFKLSDFIVLNELGKGADGTIYTVKWKKNNKKYALKKCEIIYDEIAKNKKEEINKLKEFVESTGSNGVIKIYGNLCSTNEFGTNYFYELMELAEKDWEKDILSREKKKLYYQEYELMDIFTHLIKTFSALQTINFTHRDINPQNIMMVNGSFKICDFGNSKLLKKGGNIIQKIRGSEIFMSPIVFKGYHSGVQTIKHNTFKSDVFSLGMCFFLAASLSYDALNAIREIYDMKIINKMLKKFLGKRYSQNLISLLSNMLQVEEKKRPDFQELELSLP